MGSTPPSAGVTPAPSINRKMARPPFCSGFFFLCHSVPVSFRAKVAVAKNPDPASDVRGGIRKVVLNIPRFSLFTGCRASPAQGGVEPTAGSTTIKFPMAASILPPGPGLFATFDFVRNPFRFLDTCARRYGDWFTVRVPGVSPFVFTSDPAAVREVFLGDADALHAGEANRPLGAFMGERSSLFLDAPEHLRQRRLLLPAFHGEQVASHADAMRIAADNAIASWPRGQQFPIHPQMRAITFETIIRTVFGFADDGTGTELRASLKKLFALYSSGLGTLLSPARDAHRRRRVESVGPRGQADAPDRFDPVRGIRAAEKGGRRGTRGRPLDAAICALRKRTAAPRQRHPRRDVHADARRPRNHRRHDGVDNQPAGHASRRDGTRARRDRFSIKRRAARRVARRQIEICRGGDQRDDAPGPGHPKLRPHTDKAAENRRPRPTRRRDDRTMHLPGASPPRAMAEPRRNSTPTDSWNPAKAHTPSSPSAAAPADAWAQPSRRIR